MVSQDLKQEALLERHGGNEDSQENAGGRKDPLRGEGDGYSLFGTFAYT